MKRAIFLLLLIPLMAFTCYEPYNPYSQYKPVLMERDMLESSVTYVGEQALIRPGKIYFKGDTIYINEKYKGIHVIDNSHPEQPRKIGFITIPGSIDMAVKKNVIYADNSVDLVAIELPTDLSQLRVTKRVRNAFPELMPPDQLTLDPTYQPENRPENTVIVAWEKNNF